MELVLLILVPLAFAILIALRPAQEAKFHAVIGTLLAAGIGVNALGRFDWGTPATMQLSGAWDCCRRSGCVSRSALILSRSC
ncbi:MAG: hypothetical protein KF705_04310 [Phycisphaeraceae bacterium]|nr:hypothetical protein [Phycisphaeraceae bacterium]